MHTLPEMIKVEVRMKIIKVRVGKFGDYHIDRVV